MRPALLFLLCLITNCVHASHHTLVVFGDSATDGGNSPALPWLIPTYAYPETPASNGAVWAVQLGNLWKTTVLPSKFGGLNFSFAGAQTSSETLEIPLATLVFPTTIATGKIFVPSLKTQVNEFLTQRKDVSKKAIVIFDPGNNDFGFHASTPVADGRLAASDTAAALLALQNAGYKNLVTFQTSTVFSKSHNHAVYTNTFNSHLLTDLNNASLHPVVISKSSFDLDVKNHLSFYGFTSLGPMATSTGPNNTFFWFDEVHLSELAHHLYSQYVYNILEAPTGWGQLAMQPFALMRGQNVSLRQELYPITSLCEGNWAPFITGSYIPVEQAPGVSTSGSGWNGTIGTMVRCLPHWTVGVAGSYNYSSSKNDNVLGKYEYNLHSWVASLLSGLQIDRGYLNGFLNVGWIGFHPIIRQFSMGPKTWRAKGKTHGMQYDVLFEGGWYFFRNDDCQLGPMGTIEYQHADIHGYREHDASYNNLEYKSQHPNSLVTGLGVEAVIWKPWRKECDSGFSMQMFITANEQWLERDRVHFRQIAVGQEAPFGDWPIDQEMTFFVSFGVSASYSMKNSAIFNWGYRGNCGQNHMFEQNLTASLLFPIAPKQIKDQSKQKTSRKKTD